MHPVNGLCERSFFYLWSLCVAPPTFFFLFLVNFLDPWNDVQVLRHTDWLIGTSTENANASHKIMGLRESERAREWKRERKRRVQIAHTRANWILFMCFVVCFFVPQQKKCQVRLHEYIDLSVFHARQSFQAFWTNNIALNLHCERHSTTIYCVCAWLWRIARNEKEDERKKTELFFYRKN